MEKVFISLQGEDRVVRFSLDETSGRLRDPRATEVAGGPAAMTVSRDGRMLYVGLRGEPGIACFSIEDDQLDPVGTVALDSDPCFLTLDGSENFVLTTYYKAGMVVVHRIDSGRSIVPHPVQVLETFPKAHSIQLSKTNDFAFVPHTGPNRVMQFHFDGMTGLLRPNSVPYADVPPDVEPRHFAMDAPGEYLYCANEKDSSVTTYRLNGSEGRLTTLGTVSTLPAGFAGDNTCAQIRVSPDNRYLYVGNRGHDSIAVFEIDSESRLPGRAGNFPTDGHPRALFMDRQGRYFMAAGFDTGRVVAYRIDQQTGGLERTDAVEVGRTPMWILSA